MARFAPLWQQANSYPASLDRSLLTAEWPFGGAPLGGPPVVVSATMNVSIPAGTIIVPLQAGQGSALCRWDAAEIVTLDPASHPAGQSRIDRVVCQVRDNAIDSGGFNDFVFQKVTGVPAASNPVVPALPTNSFLVCEVTVPGAVANLNTATLNDRRLGAWITPTLAAGWGTYAGFLAPAYMIDGRGRGWLRGTAQFTGTYTSGSIFTMPVPMAPSLSQRFAVMAQQTTPVTGPPFITVNNGGQVNPNFASGAANNNPYICLDNVTGWTAQGPFW